MEVDLKDLLVASGKLAQMAQVYEKVIDRLQVLTGRDAAAFEDGAVYDAWAGLRNTFWRFSAETQDNLNATSVTMIHYINAVCEQDDENAKDLFDTIVDYNDELWRDSQRFGEYLGPGLEAPDLDNPDQVYEVPPHEPADRPPEEGR